MVDAGANQSLRLRWSIRSIVLSMTISVSVSMYNTDNTKGGLLPRGPEDPGAISYGQLEVFFKSLPVHV
jgi:hypothetical protein